jgi:hypothetical protein
MPFPTDLDNFFDPGATTPLNNTPKGHSDWHTDPNTAIEALEEKVGADSSAVTTSHDYKLSGVTGSDKAVSKTGTETLTNKTLTSPVINNPTGAVAGKLGSAKRTSTFTTTTVGSLVDVTDLSVTVTVPEGDRGIKITVFGNNLANDTSVSYLQTVIREGSTTLQIATVDQAAVGDRVPFSCIYVGTATAGSHTYKASILQENAGTLSLAAAATYPAFILVELI